MTESRASVCGASEKNWGGESPMQLRDGAA